MSDKYINLNWGDRFLSTQILRDAYLKYEESLNPTAPNFVQLDDGLELGIVSSQVPEIANAVSSILTRSLDEVRNSREGYLPDVAVDRVQTDIISPHGIATLWGTTGHRFVLSRRMGAHTSEIIGSLLVGRSKDTIFFFTGRYNNLRHSTIKQDVDLTQPDNFDPNHKWFDRFAFPDLDNFKPKSYHQIANFVINIEQRGQGYGRLFLDSIVKYYSRDHIEANQDKITHSQHLLCGKGLWQIGDPPWLPKMQALGFYRRAGAESFFIEHDWAPLPPVYWLTERVDNLRYNQYFGMPSAYENVKIERQYDAFNPFTPSSKTDEHLLDRIPEVIRLSKNPKAKLQYIQAMFNFV